MVAPNIANLVIDQLPPLRRNPIFYAIRSYLDGQGDPWLLALVQGDRKIAEELCCDLPIVRELASARGEETVLGALREEAAAILARRVSEASVAAMVGPEDLVEFWLRTRTA